MVRGEEEPVSEGGVDNNSPSPSAVDGERAFRDRVLRTREGSVTVLPVGMRTFAPAAVAAVEGGVGVGVGYPVADVVVGEEEKEGEARRWV